MFYRWKRYMIVSNFGYFYFRLYVSFWHEKMFFFFFFRRFIAQSEKKTDDITKSVGCMATIYLYQIWLAHLKWIVFRGYSVLHFHPILFIHRSVEIKVAQWGYLVEKEAIYHCNSTAVTIETSLYVPDVHLRLNCKKKEIPLWFYFVLVLIT